MGSPTRQVYTAFSDELFEKLSELDIQLLLSGFGGDEGVSHNGLGFFEEMAGEGRWDIYISEMRHRNRQLDKPEYIAYVRYLLARYTPVGIDLLASKLGLSRRNRAAFRGFGFDKEFGRKLHISKKYSMNKGGHTPRTIAERQLSRISHPYISERLTNAFMAGIKHGFSYSFPLLDADLLNFHLALPSTYKYHNGMGRALFRESLKGIVPESIRLRREKHATTIPAVHKRLIRDYDHIKELITRSSSANKYHFVDYSRALRWLDLMKTREHRSDIAYNPGAFFNTLQMLLLQEMERSGEYKSGIYC
jgi:asparagine synthase (glutamine-hydrolysing)